MCVNEETETNTEIKNFMGFFYVSTFFVPPVYYRTIAKD